MLEYGKYRLAAVSLLLFLFPSVGISMFLVSSRKKELSLRAGHLYCLNPFYQGSLIQQQQQLTIICTQRFYN